MVTTLIASWWLGLSYVRRLGFRDRRFGIGLHDVTGLQVLFGDVLHFGHICRMRRIHLGQLRVIPRKIGTHQIAIPLSAASSPFILSGVGGRRHGMLRELDATESVAVLVMHDFPARTLRTASSPSALVRGRRQWWQLLQFDVGSRRRRRPIFDPLR